MGAARSVRANADVLLQYPLILRMTEKGDDERKRRARNTRKKKKTVMVERNTGARSHTMTVKTIVTMIGDGGEERNPMTKARKTRIAGTAGEDHIGAVIAMMMTNGVVASDGPEAGIQVVHTRHPARRTATRMSGWRSRPSHSWRKRNTQELHHSLLIKRRGPHPTQ